ncbi:hypothetical protein [Thermococcus sp.]|nr:hypothetical protein [Thermococcus sp.]
MRSEILEEFNGELCTMSDEEMLREGLTKDDIKSQSVLQIA